MGYKYENRRRNVPGGHSWYRVGVDGGGNEVTGRYVPGPISKTDVWREESREFKKAASRTRCLNGGELDRY